MLCKKENIRVGNKNENAYYEKSNIISCLCLHIFDTVGKSTRE